MELGGCARLACGRNAREGQCTHLQQVTASVSRFAAGFQSQIGAMQSQIIDNSREARTGTAIALALGGTANLQPGRRVAVSAGYGNFQGSNAFGAGVTGLLLDTPNFAVVANAGVGFGVGPNVVGTRGAVSLQW